MQNRNFKLLKNMSFPNFDSQNMINLWFMVVEAEELDYLQKFGFGTGILRNGNSHGPLVNFISVVCSIK